MYKERKNVTRKEYKIKKFVRFEKLVFIERGTAGYRVHQNKEGESGI